MTTPVPPSPERLAGNGTAAARTAAPQHDQRAKRTSLVLKVGKVVVFVTYVVILAYVVILGLAFFLRLFGANPDADFADWVYRASARIMQPFRGIFPTTQLSDRSEFDASLLFAIVVYAVVAVVLHLIVDRFTRKIAKVDDERERRRYWATMSAMAVPAPAVPTTAVPTTAVPTTAVPTTAVPTTSSASPASLSRTDVPSAPSPAEEPDGP